MADIVQCDLSERDLFTLKIAHASADEAANDLHEMLVNDGEDEINHEGTRAVLREAAKNFQFAARALKALIDEQTPAEPGPDLDEEVKF